MLNDSDRLVVNSDRAAGDVMDGEAIIIDLETGVYYSMQGIGGEIWAMISEGRSIGSMVGEIVATRDVAPEQARADLHAVLQKLLAEDLVRVAGNGNGSPMMIVERDTKQPYVAPSLEIYRDMQDLLALDPPAPGMNRIAWRDPGEPQ